MGMTTQTLEERVATLEKELSEVKLLLKQPRREKDWRRTVGMFANDPFYEEVIRLGREYREQENQRSLE